MSSTKLHVMQKSGYVSHTTFENGHVARCLCCTGQLGQSRIKHCFTIGKIPWCAVVTTDQAMQTATELVKLQSCAAEKQTMGIAWKKAVDEGIQLMDDEGKLTVGACRPGSCDIQ